MKTIPDSVYSSLTPAQRMAATISAIARGDESERERLKRTCEKHAYLITDPEYTNRMEKIMDVAMAIECEMRGYAIEFFAASREEDADAQEAAIVKAQSVHVAWKEILIECGIDAGEMEKAGPPRHPFVTALLTLGLKEDLPELVQDAGQQIREAMP